MNLCDTTALPVFADVDVLVAGGGPAGIAAALAAARNGCSVLVVEQFNCLGGVATAGGHGHISNYNEHKTDRRIAGGIAHEIGNRIVDGGFGFRNALGVWFEHEPLKFLLETMAGEAGVRLLYHTFYCDTVMDGNAVAGAVVQNKTGRGVVRARRIVDGTGDGDAAFHAGCAFAMGRPGDGKCQPVTLMFTVTGVDWPRLRKFKEEYCRQRPENPQAWKLEDVYAEAVRNGDMRPFQTGNMGWEWTPTQPDAVGINFTHVTNVDCTKAEDLTRATLEARRQAFETIAVFRKYLPGMENIRLVSFPATIGLRESRHIVGLHTLTEQEGMAQCRFPDSIGFCSFFFDIHNVDGPGMDRDTWYPAPGFKFQMPYRILVPRDVENLLVAGRCVSCTHVALGALREMVQCMVMGEAAGTAAALSLKQGVAPRALDITLLQTSLRLAVGILDDADIDAAERADITAGRQYKGHGYAL